MSERMDVDPSRKGKDPQASGSGGTALRTGRGDPLGNTLPRWVSKETHKIKNGAVTLYALGDSHLRKGHNFPEAYAEARAAGATDQRFSAINRKLTWERPGSKFAEGYRLDEAYTKQLLDLIEDHRGRATAFFLSVGTNELREAKEKREKTVDKLMERFRTIMKKIMDTPGTVLFILEPIPCCEGIEDARDRLDSELDTECRKNRKVRYVTLTHGDEPEITKIEGMFYQEEFWEDTKHLNKKGAELLVKRLIKVQGKVDSSLFLMDPEAREKRPPIRKGPLEPQNHQGHGPQEQPYYKNQDPPGSFKPKMTGPPNRSGERTDSGWKKPRPHPFEGQAASRGPIHRRLGYFTTKYEGLPSHEHRARAEKAPLRDPRLNTAYYHEKRMAANSAYDAAIDAAKIAYDATLKKIDEAEKERKPVEGEEEIEPPTPYCRPYEEPRHYDQGPGGPGGFGGFGQFCGYGAPGPFGNMPPPMMFYGYPYIPPQK
jgi:lysophospholipase L1-like esterase